MPRPVRRLRRLASPSSARKPSWLRTNPMVSLYSWCSSGDGVMCGCSGRRGGRFRSCATLNTCVSTNVTPPVVVRTLYYGVVHSTTLLKPTSLRTLGLASERDIADATREADSLWARCTLWELTPAVCDFATTVAPLRPLRALDALHAATCLLARRRLATDVALITADQQLEAAVHAVGAES
jgi:predicted nucleic acid-binding protein